MDAINTIDHPVHPDWWRNEPATFGKCGGCGESTEWIYLDMEYMHPTLECEELAYGGGTV